MKSIKYPNQLDDIAVVEYRGEAQVGFTIMTKLPGFFRLLVWPDGMPDPDLLVHVNITVRPNTGPPVHQVVDLRNHKARDIPSWCWALVHRGPIPNALSDYSSLMLSENAIARGHFNLYGSNSNNQVKTVVWSCHMPYETVNKSAIMQEDAADILEWYAEIVHQYRPHLIWGAGDTSYSDGTEATDFSNQVYEKGNWYHNPRNRQWLKQEYRSMYRHFWSFPPMQQVMREFPHIFIWDDHEIHDGWGSEGIDFQPGNLEMFKVAKEVAEEYILNAGPRVRRKGEEAHQAYIMGSLACFIFDTRSSRNYESPTDRLISKQQFEDFQYFLNIVQGREGITDLITCTTVPFVNMRTWVMELGSRAPDFLNDNFIQGVRDDIRDSWTSPGNIDTLESVLQIIGLFMQGRSDIRVWNVSGDIHVANAYEIYIPGVTRPLRQVTTSAITNRHHPNELVESLTEISDGTYIKGVGQVRRIWPTVTQPNVLFLSTGPEGSEVRLKVWEKDAVDSTDLLIRH